MKNFGLFLIPSILAAFVVGETLGGLGNNLFQVATASALAWDHGVEAYFPRLTHTPKLVQHVFSRCKLFPPDPEVAGQWGEKGHPFQPIPYHPKIKISGYFQSYKYFSHHREKLLELFAPTKRDLQYIKNNYGWLIEHPNTVGIQIRYYFEDPQGHIFVQYGKEYLEKAMAFFPQDSLFIVSSNNLAFAKKELEGIKVFFLEDEPCYIDFYLLSFCKNHIITNSTFGWWAAWLSQNEDKKVIAPKLWFHGFDTRDHCPPNWMQIDG